MVLPSLIPGQVVGLEGETGLGITRLGFSILARPSRVGLVVAVDVRGWLSPLAAFESGVVPARLVVVRCEDHRLWPQVTAACLEGVAAVYAEVPGGVGESQLRRLAALNRARRSALILHPLRGELPVGVAHWRIKGERVSWEGPDRGHGRLKNRQLSLQISGKSMPLRQGWLEEGAA